MKFGATPLDDAEGTILAHSVRFGRGRLRKGRILSRDDLAALRRAGLDSVVVVRLEPGDLDENAAAARIAGSCRGDNVEAGKAFTGRCNLTASRAGVLVLDEPRIDRLNRVDEAVTLSTLGRFEAVRPGQMVATVKIITFGITGKVAEEAVSVAGESPDLIRIAAFRPVSVGLIQTLIPGLSGSTTDLKESVAEKAVATTRARVEACGASLDHDIRCGHTEKEVAEALERLRAAGCGIALALGASAIVDRRDVVPAAVMRAGGTVVHFGMPVDPGQLILLARLGDMHVLGLPGSARSPRPHGFDWVLQRLIAGLEVTGGDLMGMGVGGLLKEIPSRPMPRDEAPAGRHGPRVAALVLAAGQSRRMGPVNKLLADIEGRPMVARTVDAALASMADPVVVVLGHEADRVRAALEDRPVTFVVNPGYADGLSGSLGHGLAVLPDEIDGVVVCLGDMPRVAPEHIDRLIAAFDPGEDRGVCVPTFNGKRGNPVLWDRRYFAEMAEIAGDVGARHLIGAHDDAVCEVAMPDGGVLLDLDTPEALARHTAAGEADG